LSCLEADSEDFGHRQRRALREGFGCGDVILQELASNVFKEGACFGAKRPEYDEALHGDGEGEEGGEEDDGECKAAGGAKAVQV